MRIALVGAELEENLGIRDIASSVEARGHEADIVPFNEARDLDEVVRTVLATAPDITGLSMVFNARGREFCALASALREAGYRGHIIGGGPFASFNCERLLLDFPAFDSIGLGEGEGLMCDLADRLDDVPSVAGLCYRNADGRPVINFATGQVRSSGQSALAEARRLRNVLWQAGRQHAHQSRLLARLRILTSFVTAASLASISPRNLASPARPASVSATAMRDFETSMPTKTSL